LLPGSRHGGAAAGINVTYRSARDDADTRWDGPLLAGDVDKQAALGRRQRSGHDIDEQHASSVPVIGRWRLGDGTFVRVSETTLDVPLYWQCWTLDSPVVKTVTEAMRSTAGLGR
jgi:hypothetical protein